MRAWIGRGLIGLALGGLVLAGGQWGSEGRAAEQGAGADGFAGDARRLASAAWLGHGWVNGTPAESQEHLLEQLRAHGVRYLLVNVGRAGADGRVRDGQATLGRFLDGVGRRERESGERWTLLAWVAVRTDVTDVTAPAVRAVLARSAGELAGRKGPDTGRSFDGVILDAEPVGGNPALLTAYLDLLDQVRTGLGPGAVVASATPRIGTSPGPWSWPASDFTRVAPHVDFLFVNAYNSGLTRDRDATPDRYREWVADLTEGVLRAVAAGAPVPDRMPARVFVSLPAYPATASPAGSGRHDPAVERAGDGARGVLEALRRLAPGRPDAAAHLAGVALYAHTDGSGRDGYAAYDRDWLPLTAVLSGQAE